MIMQKGVRDRIGIKRGIGIERDRDGKRDRNGIKRGMGIKRDERGMGLSIPTPLWL
jgi:hypothetical protein